MSKSAADRGIVARIEAFNVKRDPERLVRKYALMRADVFAFFRGTAHLFWEDWARAKTPLDRAPLAWSCGDAHLENFGTFRGDNRLVYFDLNDFDDAGLAPATADVVRLLTSVHVAARSLSLRHGDASALCRNLLDAYAAALADGKARWVERATARGMVRDLLCAARERTRAELLDARTIVEDGERRLIIDGRRTDRLEAGERSAIKACIRKHAGTLGRREEASFFRVLDVARRIAGLSSLGLRRYVALIEGRGGEDGQYLLDLKEIRASAMVTQLHIAQPRWKNEAERVVRIQHRMQAVSPALLAPASIGRTRFVIRELQPIQDRLALGAWNGRIGRLRKVVVTMGHLVAWAQLRAASREGSASADALIAFGRDRSWRRAAADYAKAYSLVADRDWRAFGGGEESKPSTRARTARVDRVAT